MTTCPKCELNGTFSKQYVVVDGNGPPRLERLFRESFTYNFDAPKDELVWDMEQARSVIASRPREPVRVDAEWLATWLSNKDTFVPTHLDHIPVNKRDEPGILVRLAHHTSPGEHIVWLPVLIDGTHRGALAVRDGRDFYAYELTQNEQYSICTYTPEGGSPHKLLACGCTSRWQHFRRVASRIVHFVPLVAFGCGLLLLLLFVIGNVHFAT